MMESDLARNRVGAGHVSALPLPPFLQAWPQDFRKNLTRFRTQQIELSKFFRSVEDSDLLTDEKLVEVLNGVFAGGEIKIEPESVRLILSRQMIDAAKGNHLGLGIGEKHLATRSHGKIANIVRAHIVDKPRRIPTPHLYF